jgi:hypothetical protein
LGDGSVISELIVSGQEYRLAQVGKIQDRWLSWNPTLSWTTGTPASPTITGRYKVIGSTCFFSLSVSSSDGNGATDVSATIPIPAYNNTVVNASSAFHAVASVYTVDPSYYVFSNGNIVVKFATPATDNLEFMFAVSGFYEIA